MTTCGAVASTMGSECANTGRSSPACAVCALLAASAAILYMFPNGRQEWTYALVGAAAFAFLGLKKPGEGRLAEKRAFFVKENVLGVTEGVTCKTRISNPSCDDALLDAIGTFDHRAREFVILVQQWAEENGLASAPGFAAEGKLPTLAWQLLAIYFLQVAETVTARLPGLDVISSGKPCDHQWKGLDTSVAELFRDFVEFYHSDFDWEDEAACVKAAQRDQPRPGLSQGTLASENGYATMLCPGIEHPFQPGTNLGNSLDADNFQLIQGELAHTAMMHKQEASCCMTTCGAVASTMGSECAHTGRSAPACAEGPLLAASVAILYTFATECPEWTYALVGAGVFAFLELNKPSKGRLAEKKKALFAKEGVSAITNNAIFKAATTSNSICGATLLEALGTFDLRAQQFVVLVQRWAEQAELASTPGVAAEGRLPTLAWQLLAIYFLQVSEKVTATLPGLDVIASGNPGHQWEGLGMSVAELFRAFVEFYASDFDWQDEAACVRAAKRGQPRVGLNQSALASEDGFATMLCPGIENPFEPGANLGNLLDADNFHRIQGELAYTVMMHNRMDAP